MPKVYWRGQVWDADELGSGGKRLFQIGSEFVCEGDAVEVGPDIATGAAPLPPPVPEFFDDDADEPEHDHSGPLNFNAAPAPALGGKDLEDIPLELRQDAAGGGDKSAPVADPRAAAKRRRSSK